MGKKILALILVHSDYSTLPDFKPLPLFTSFCSVLFQLTFVLVHQTMIYNSYICLRQNVTCKTPKLNPTGNTKSINGIKSPSVLVLINLYLIMTEKVLFQSLTGLYQFQPNPEHEKPENCPHGKSISLLLTVFMVKSMQHQSLN